MNEAEHWIQQLDLVEHPEGGFYSETYRSSQSIVQEALPEDYPSSRCFGTSIYFLLKSDQKSKFHRLRSDEIWYFHAGASARIHFISPDGEYFERLVGLDRKNGETPQVIIPKNHWFAIEVILDNSYVLVGCAVFPGFEFEDFELVNASQLSQEFPHHSALIQRFS